MRSAKILGSPLGLYSILYLLLFLQFPLKGHLPGNCDTLASIALTNVWNEKVSLFFRGESLATVMFPSTNFQAYGENCYAIGLIFTLFKLLTQSDHWAYYLLVVSVFTSNSFGLFKLLTLYVRDSRVALLGGLSFSLAGFTLGNIDDINVVFVFFPLLAFYLLELGIRQGDTKLFRWAFLLTGLQIWFGMYVFTFHVIALAVFLLARLRDVRQLLSMRSALRAALAFAVPSVPIMILYIYNGSLADLVSPYANPLGRRLSSLHWYHFKNVLPGNLLYSSDANDWRPDSDVSPWYNVRKTCFPGFLLPAFALVGAVKTYRKTWAYLIIGLVFLGLAFGTNLFDFEHLVSDLPFGSFFRVASRAYLFTLIVLALHFAIGVDFCFGKLAAMSKATALAFIAIVGIGFLAENVPAPMPSWNFATLLEPPRGYTRFFEKFEERQIVADLPSDYRALLPQTAPVWTFSRELLYMNWQSYHRQIILGGVNGYLPEVRIETDGLLHLVPERSALEKLRKIGTGFLVFHKKLVVFEPENALEALRASPDLELEYEDDDVAIFRI